MDKNGNLFLALPKGQAFTTRSLRGAQTNRSILNALSVTFLIFCL